LASPPIDRAVLHSTPARSARQRPRRGFSLLELTIVLIIISIVATIGSVRYAGALATYRVDAAARRLVADLSAARQRARTEGVRVYVQFDPTISTYTVMTGAEIDAQESGSSTLTHGPIRVDLREGPYNSRISRLRSGSGQPKAVFDVYGMSDTTIEITLAVGGSNGRSRLVVLDASSGRATIQ
jgi:prepilin-type N-terminal cleavage/methylation domain-containing protein